MIQEVLIITIYLLHVSISTCIFGNTYIHGRVTYIQYNTWNGNKTVVDLQVTRVMKPSSCMIRLHLIKSIIQNNIRLFRCLLK